VSALVLAVALSTRVAAAATADAETRCAESFTAEKLLRSRPADNENGALFDYATCAQLTGGAGTSLCPYLPGGPESKIPLSEAPRTYSYVDSKGRVELESEYEICATKAPGYAFLGGVLRGAPRSELVPLMRTLMKGATELTAEDGVDGALEIYQKGRVETARIPKAVLNVGFFHFLAGVKACSHVKIAKVRGECVAKARALEALKTRDARRCAEGDVMCRTLVAGEPACREVGLEAVRRFCRRKFGVELETHDLR